MGNVKVASNERAEGAQDPRSCYINVRAKEARKNEDGTWNLEIKARGLTPNEHSVLAELFPDLAEQAYALLDKQMLLDAIVRGR